MIKSINLNKKCLDLHLAGEVDPKGTITSVMPQTIAIIPDDFTGLTPKPAVKPEDKVNVGDTLFFDKNDTSLCVTSPVAGTVKAIVRGERRKILRIEVEVAKEQSYKSIDVNSVKNSEDAIRVLAQSGLLAFFRRRPYDIIPSTTDKVRDVFVTAIDSAPLAYPAAVLLKDKKKELEAGVALLQKVTSGDVYVSVGKDWTMGELKGAKMYEFVGCHPVGNVGVQIANIKPINKGETVWGLDLVTLYKIGDLALTGKVDGNVTVAVTGSEVEKPCLIKTVEGCPVGDLLKGNLKKDGHHKRIISGNVLVGEVVEDNAESFLHFPWKQITVIPEGDDVDEFMGWASLSPNKMSESPTFLGRLFKNKKFSPDARLLGGRRAMIMSGQYDKVMPMDILPEYLIKAILSRDIEKMEQLGIYEVAPEDFALAEYVDTSKIDLMREVRQGLDWLRKELQ